MDEHKLMVRVHLANEFQIISQDEGGPIPFSNALGLYCAVWQAYLNWHLSPFYGPNVTLKVCNAKFSCDSNQINLVAHVEISLPNYFNAYPSTLELQILPADTDKFIEFLSE